MWGRLAISTTPTSPTSDTLTKTSEHGRTCWCSSDMDWKIRDNKPHITYCYCEANLLWRIIVSSYPIIFSLDLLGCVLHAWHISKFDDSIFAYLSSYILCSTLHYKPHNGDCTHRVCYRIYPYTYLKSNPNCLIRVLSWRPWLDLSTCWPMLFSRRYCQPPTSKHLFVIPNVRRTVEVSARNSCCLFSPIVPPQYRPSKLSHRFSILRQDRTWCNRWRGEPWSVLSERTHLFVWTLPHWQVVFQVFQSYSSDQNEVVTCEVLRRWCICVRCVRVYPWCLSDILVILLSWYE